MCGIVGLVARRGVPERAVLETMRDTMRHRGPDDAGVWWSGDRTVGLGHRRLSIIDLSALGHQPMTDSSHTCVGILNGEIYNYRSLRTELAASGYTFRSASDTEVLLAAYRAWGDACLDRLDGMYAFALYDVPRRRLLLARDRAGEKPLFVQRTPDGLAFGSELKALLARPGAPRVLDLDAFEFYLAYGYVPGDRCILQGYEKLPAGHALAYEVASGTLRTWRYWDLPPAAPVTGAAPTAEELVGELDTLLQESVRLRLLTADVPVGILLSGGVDSSLVVAAAARALDVPLRTYTITFPGGGDHDESAYARIVASHFGTRHTELPAEGAAADLLPALARQYDEPLADPSVVPTYLVSRLIRTECTVAIGGDGGDELFGGYGWYPLLLRQARWRRWIPRGVRTLGGSALRRTPLGLRGRNFMLGLTMDDGGAIAQFNTFFDARARRALLRRPGPPRADEPVLYKRRWADQPGSLLQRATRTDFHSYLVDDILVKVDRAAMLTSLEVRAPWLARAVVEFAFGRVPDAWRATERRAKILPKLLARRVLPPTLDVERKRGFAVPLSLWMRGPWGDCIRDLVTSADRRLLNPDAVATLLAHQRRGLVTEARLFALAMLELWRQTYDVDIPA